MNIIKYKTLILIILNILILRIFIIEPFRIPSGSMMPTLLPGDFILVNKFCYGINLPFSNKKIIKTNVPERGDVIIFNHNKKKYIKRVIGIPGDRITYKDKKLKINNILIENKLITNDIEFEENNILELKKYKELLSPKKEYTIQEYIHSENKYDYTDIILEENSYFVMGDNRDNSYDSRSWGIVKTSDILGKAIIIWISFDISNYIIRANRINKEIK